MVAANKETLVAAGGVSIVHKQPGARVATRVHTWRHTVASRNVHRIAARREYSVACVPRRGCRGALLFGEIASTWPFLRVTVLEKVVVLRRYGGNQRGGKQREEQCHRLR